jgi:hypothetical protein
LLPGGIFSMGNRFLRQFGDEGWNRRLRVAIDMIDEPHCCCSRKRREFYSYLLSASLDRLKFMGLEFDRPAYAEVFCHYAKASIGKPLVLALPSPFGSKL